MKAQGIGLVELAARTVEAGQGVSFQLVAFLATSKGYARESTRAETADAIEDALGVPRGSLFERVQVPTKAELRDEQIAS